MADVRDAGHAVLVPAVRARAGVVVREVVPGVAALRVVLAHRAPGALAQVRAPLVPGVRVEEVVLGAAGRLGEARVLGGLGFGMRISPPGQACQVEEVPSPTGRARRRGRRAGRRRCARRPRPLERVGEPPRAGRAGRPTAARRAPPRARRRGSRRRACAGRRRASPRRRGSARCRCPPSPLRSPSCQSPLRKTASRSAREEPLVERAQVGVGLLVGAAGEEDGQAAPSPALELPLVHEPRAGLRQRRDRRRTALPGRERGRRTRLVVVLDEADEPLLVADVGRSGGRAPTRRPRARAGRRGACRSSSRSPAAGARTRGPSRPRP